jgi:hypothetical protein
MLSGFGRGLSVRDVEAALAEALGPEAALSTSTVARICEAIKHRSTPGGTVVFSGIELESLCLDGGHLRMHAGARAEPVLCAWRDHHPGQPGAGRTGVGQRRRPRPLGWVHRRAGGPRAATAAAGDHRRDSGAGRRGRGLLATSLRQRCLQHSVSGTVAHPGRMPWAWAHDAIRLGEDSPVAATMLALGSLLRGSAARLSVGHASPRRSSWPRGSSPTGAPRSQVPRTTPESRRSS